MKVFYKTTTDAGRASYRALRMASCCDPMEEAWDEVVVFGCGDDGGGKLPVAHIDHRTAGYENIEHDYMPIAFCPFCGAKVECVEEQRVRVVVETEQYHVNETRTRRVRKEVPE